MLSAILREAHTRNIPLTIKSAAIMKRGVCNFVYKAKVVARDGAGLGLLINSGKWLIYCNKRRSERAMCACG
jgi:hypothetical protein